MAAGPRSASPPPANLKALLGELTNGEHPQIQDEFFYCPLKVMHDYDLSLGERVALFRLVEAELAAINSAVWGYRVKDDFNLGGSDTTIPSSGWRPVSDPIDSECRVPEYGANLFLKAGGAWGTPDPQIRLVSPEALQPGQQQVVLTLVGEGLLPEGEVRIAHPLGTVATRPSEILVQTFHRIFIRTEPFDVPKEWSANPALVSVFYGVDAPPPKPKYIKVKP